MPWSRKAAGLCLLFAFALALRVAAVALLHTRHDAPVTYEHGEIAENLLVGRGFSVRFLGVTGPTSQQAPIYPVMLAAVYSLFGAGTTTSILAMQILQCLAGAAITLVVANLAWSLLPARQSLGWVAGLGAALYPPHIYMVTHIQVATWTALLLTLTLAVAVSPRFAGKLSGALLAGVLGGLLLLFEPICALAMPFVALAFVQFGREAGALKQRLRNAALMACAALAVVSPWIARNYRVHGEFVFVKSTFGYAFWQGNNSHSWGTDKIPKTAADIAAERGGTWADANRRIWEARHETLYIDDVLLTPEDYALFATQSEPERCRELQSRAVTFIREQPYEYGRLCLKRLQYLLLFDETNPKASHPIYRASTLAWLVTFAAGAILLRRDWRRVWPVLAISSAIVLFHVLTIASARFRMPVEPLTFVCCAAALTRRSR